MTALASPASTLALAGAPGPAPALALHDVVKSYGGRRILDALNLAISGGTLVALLGPNGAGKSTLLRIAANVTPCDQGTVHVEGTPVRHDTPAARRAIAYVGQDPALYDDLTPAEHVTFWARLHDAPVDPNHVLGEAGLAAAAHKPTGTLSRGQRQRLALSLALHAAPAKSLLVLDEPFTALDAAAHDALEQTLRDRRAQGAAILVALHDEAQARRLADRLVRLVHHRLVEVPA